MQLPDRSSQQLTALITYALEIRPTPSCAARCTTKICFLVLSWNFTVPDRQLCTLRCLLITSTTASFSSLRLEGDLEHTAKLGAEEARGVREGARGGVEGEAAEEIPSGDKKSSATAAAQASATRTQRPSDWGVERRLWVIMWSGRAPLRRIGIRRAIERYSWASLQNVNACTQIVVYNIRRVTS